MANVSMLVKDWTLEVNTATAGAAEPTWTPVKGLNNISINRDSNTEDDSDFDGDGWGSTVVTQRSWSIEIGGKRKRVLGTGFIPDAGQEAIRKAGDLVGLDANIEVRWYRKDGAPDAYEGLVSVSPGATGGAVTDTEPFAFTLNGQGKPVAITNPATAGA